MGRPATRRSAGQAAAQWRRLRRIVGNQRSSLARQHRRRTVPIRDKPCDTDGTRAGRAARRGRRHAMRVSRGWSSCSTPGTGSRCRSIPARRTWCGLWPGEGSKTEAWFVLAAAPGSRVYAGLLPGVDEKCLRTALREGTVGDCLHQFSPRPGDCVFLPAGTVHAVGGGVLMAEVQQTSDATFRLFDWNRRDAQGQMRQLHIEEALACIDWNSGPVHPIHARNYPGSADASSRQPTSAPVRQRLVSCSYFTLDYLRDSEPFTCGGSGRLAGAAGAARSRPTVDRRGRLAADPRRHAAVAGRSRCPDLPSRGRPGDSVIDATSTIRHRVATLRGSVRATTLLRSVANRPATCIPA